MPLKILNMNFQSLKNKKPDLLEIIDSVKPDIFMGTETWLDSNIFSYDYCPSNSYNVYRHDIPPNIEDQSHGGAIKKDFVSSEITELKTNCEIIWADINIAGSKNLQVASYYRPPSDKGQALKQLQSSINRINRQSNSTVIIGCDFNLGHIDWSNNCVITGRPDQSEHQQHLDIIHESNRHQVVDMPTRNDRILDLVLINIQTRINKISTAPHWTT